MHYNASTCAGGTVHSPPLSGETMGEDLPAKVPRKRKPKPASPADFPLVAIGMSAGGLETISPFLKAMPPDSGMGIVIIQHLEPSRKSLLAELMGKDTAMPVVEITDGMKVEPDRVHVIAPGRTLLIEDNSFTLIDPKEKRGFRHPIDKFFNALAKDRGAKAIGIILTGAGSNGTAGLLDIKQAGGLCIAQDPETAKFDSMPRHAIASGAVDYVLAPEKIPEAVLAFARHPYLEHPSDPEALADGGPAGLGDVLTLIRARTGQDFRQYKASTLNRRIYRRMGLARVERLEDYLGLLRKDSGELDALVKDLAINVTGFFRDPEAWNALEKDAIGPIVANATPNNPIRVWVPACSTGDEAYSLAIMVAEQIDRSGKRLSMKIFATDVGEQNLAMARKGIFPGSMVESLLPERLERYFDKVGDDYQIKPDIRESVLFASQNLLSDPPYSRMDLVSCRNLLIYLKPDAQSTSSRSRISRSRRAAICSWAMPRPSATRRICSRRCPSAGGFTSGSGRHGRARSIFPAGPHASNPWFPNLRSRRSRMSRRARWHGASGQRRW